MEEIDINDPKEVYEVIRGHYSAILEDSDQVISAFQEASDIDKEGIEDIYPLVVENNKNLKAIFDKLNTKETKDWFVSNIESQIKEKVPTKDLNTIKRAKVIQKTLDGIFEGAMIDLEDYLGFAISGQNTTLN